MTTPVPTYPPLIYPVSSSESDLRNSLPVKGDHWKPMARTANWLLGRGGQIVCTGPVYLPISAGGSEQYRFYAWPRRSSGGTGLNVSRIWIVTGNGSGTATTVTFQCTLSPGSDTFTRTVEPQQAFTWIMQHDSSSQADGEVSILIDETSSVSEKIILFDSIQCFEVPLADLSSTASSGARVSTVESGDDIWEAGSAADKTSLKGVWEQSKEAIDVARRQKMFDWYYPTGIVTTSTSFSNVFKHAPVIQTRHLYSGETVRTVNVAAYGTATDVDGEVRFTMASGDTATLTFTAGAGAGWQTGTIDIETDEIGQSRLVRGGTRDTCTVQRRTTGTGTFRLYGISIGE